MTDCPAVCVAGTNLRRTASAGGSASPRSSWAGTRRGRICDTWSGLCPCSEKTHRSLVEKRTETKEGRDLKRRASDKEATAVQTDKGNTLNLT